MDSLSVTSKVPCHFGNAGCSEVDWMGYMMLIEEDSNSIASCERNLHHFGREPNLWSITTTATTKSFRWIVMQTCFENVSDDDS